jgi:hypothetical protein
MKKNIFFFILIFFIFLKNSGAKELSNNVILSIDNTIVTELDLNKEINFIKFITKSNNNYDKNSIKREAINNLIDRKIKNIEASNLKVEVSEKEIEINLYNYLTGQKIKLEDVNAFYKENEIEDDYLKNIIKTDMKWSKLITDIYAGRVNINLTEINNDISKESQNSTNNEKLKNELINSERNILLNKFSASHLEKIKKKYLIKFL